MHRHVYTGESKLLFNISISLTIFFSIKTAVIFKKKKLSFSKCMSLQNLAQLEENIDYYLKFIFICTIISNCKDHLLLRNPQYIKSKRDLEIYFILIHLQRNIRIHPRHRKTQDSLEILILCTMITDS